MGLLATPLCTHSTVITIELQFSSTFRRFRTCCLTQNFRTVGGWLKQQNGYFRSALLLLHISAQGSTGIHHFILGKCTEETEISCLGNVSIFNLFSFKSEVMYYWGHTHGCATDFSRKLVHVHLNYEINDITLKLSNLQRVYCLHVVDWKGSKLIKCTWNMFSTCMNRN